MEFINDFDIRDKLLQVTEADVAEANAYVSDIAKSMGVEENSIPSVVPAKIKRLAVVYACYICCINSIGTDSTTTFDNGERTDIFEQKRVTYKEELDKIIAGLTANDFTGAQLGGNNITIWRA